MNNNVIQTTVNDQNEQNPNTQDCTWESNVTAVYEASVHREIPHTRQGSDGITVECASLALRCTHQLRLVKERRAANRDT